MLELTDAAARDIEHILDRSVVDFGLHQTELYYHTLKNCLDSWARIQIWAAALTTCGQAIAVLHMRAM